MGRLVLELPEGQREFIRPGLPRLPRSSNRWYWGETRSLFLWGRPDIVCVSRASAASGRPLIYLCPQVPVRFGNAQGKTV
jgi:hypothetical protein